MSSITYYLSIGDESSVFFSLLFICTSLAPSRSSWNQASTIDTFSHSAPQVVNKAFNPIINKAITIWLF